MFEKTTLDALPSFLFGHAQNTQGATGVTVVIAPEGATCGVEVRGGGPATRETDLLRPENMIEKVHAVVLAGGSAFGFEASCGVMDELKTRSIGFHLDSICVPIVVGACLFDLAVGENCAPDKKMGKEAVHAAFEKASFVEGNVGAGCGASVGKLLGQQNAMKSGFGMSVLRRGDLVVATLVAVNALGNVVSPDGKVLAGCRNEKGELVDGLEALSFAVEQLSQQTTTNTTLGIVVTNAQLNKAQATKVSSVVHNAYARTIRPIHTSQDGDSIFTFASGETPSSPDLVAAIATEAMVEAIYRAIETAKEAYGLKAKP